MKGRWTTRNSHPSKARRCCASSADPGFPAVIPDARLSERSGIQSRTSAFVALDSRSGFQPAGNDIPQCELFNRKRCQALLRIPDCLAFSKGANTKGANDGPRSYNLIPPADPAM
ncbi:hypothetical protein SS37A_26260 [Methylocystis iwaonis]|uniref:Uncharacterized protein n=1 Tax=Methylocystis iwaonis TaxID=2885079 RepID=A0ABM8EAT0_9HYPH|nr:hypothetical protein SS37A_26260 [Methylocystis iwaonis]